MFSQGNESMAKMYQQFFFQTQLYVASNELKVHKRFKLTLNAFSKTRNMQTMLYDLTVQRAKHCNARLLSTASSTVLCSSYVRYSTLVLCSSQVRTRVATFSLSQSGTGVWGGAPCRRASGGITPKKLLEFCIWFGAFWRNLVAVICRSLDPVHL